MSLNAKTLMCSHLADILENKASLVTWAPLTGMPNEEQVSSSESFSKLSCIKNIVNTIMFYKLLLLSSRTLTTATKTDIILSQ